MSKNTYKGHVDLLFIVVKGTIFLYYILYQRF